MRPAPSYRALLAVPGASGLLISHGVGVLSTAMWPAVLVLLVIHTYQSPELVGLVLLCDGLPASIAGPVAGALIDRYSPYRVVVADYIVTVAATCAIALLTLRGPIAPPLLLAIVALNGTTTMLSYGGTATVLPQLIPEHLWDLANSVSGATDSLFETGGFVLGALAVAFFGSQTAVLTVGGLACVGAISFPRAAATLVSRRASGRRLWHDIWDGLKYIGKNTTLRYLTLCAFIYNVSSGVLMVGIPLLAIQALRGGDRLVAVFWGIYGATIFVSMLISGRIGSRGRERLLLGFDCLCSAGAFGLIANSAATGITMNAAIGVAILGTVFGPGLLSIIGLRQRSTDLAWYGRVVSTSISVNFLGIPLGAAMGGFVSAYSLQDTFVMAAGLCLISFGLVFMFPARPESFRERLSRMA